MTERELLIECAEGAIPVFAAQPAPTGRWPVVIFYMDALGIREELRQMARRIAAEGYVCLLPDLYWRSGHVRLDFSRGNAPVLPVARALMGQLETDMVKRDTRALLEAFASDSASASGPVGCVGHCMSGRFVMAVMSQFPERMAAGAALYGTGMVTQAPDSPHTLLGRVRGELYFAFGGNDDMVPATVRATLQAALAATGVPHHIDVFEGAGHGFAFPERPAYDAAAAEASWRRVLSLFARRLKPSA